MVFIKLGKKSATVSKYFFYASLSLIPLGTPIAHILDCLNFSQRLLIPCSFFPIIIRPPSHPCFILHIFYSYRIMFINLCVYVCVRGGAMSNLLLIPSNILFISEIYRFLSLKFWFWSSLCLPCFSLKFLTHPSLLILTSVSVLSYFKLIIFFPHFRLYFQESL